MVNLNQKLDNEPSSFIKPIIPLDIWPHIRVTSLQTFSRHAIQPHRSAVSPSFGHEVPGLMKVHNWQAPAWYSIIDTPIADLIQCQESRAPLQHAVSDPWTLPHT
ncbi:unnamed protein product [Cercospora beticola]|nr:unnamed protein product [Cercospora beticola]